jgi:hypothetical protein
LLGNDSVNRFPRQRINNETIEVFLAITMETVFSVEPAPRLYNEDSRPAGRIIERVF